MAVNTLWLLVTIWGTSTHHQGERIQRAYKWAKEHGEDPKLYRCTLCEPGDLAPVDKQEIESTVRSAAESLEAVGVAVEAADMKLFKLATENLCEYLRLLETELKRRIRRERT